MIVAQVFPAPVGALQMTDLRASTLSATTRWKSSGGCFVTNSKCASKSMELAGAGWIAAIDQECSALLSDRASSRDTDIDDGMSGPVY